MGGGGAAQQSIGAQIFIDVGPVNPIAAATHPPICSLPWSSVKQPRIPGQRHDDSTPVEEVYAQHVVRAMNIFYAFTWFDF